jgi:hypothetical protein
MSARAFDMDNRFRNSNDMRERMPLPNMPRIDEGIISSPVQPLPVRGGLPPRGLAPMPIGRPIKKPMPVLQEPQPIDMPIRLDPIRGGFLPPRTRPMPIERPMPMPITQPIAPIDLPPSKGINLKELKGLGQMTGDEAIGRAVPKMPDISLLRPEDRRRFLQNRPIARPEMPVMMLPDIEVGQQLPPPMPSVDMQMDELEPIESFAEGGVVEDQMPEIPDEDLPLGRDIATSRFGPEGVDIPLSQRNAPVLNVLDLIIQESQKNYSNEMQNLKNQIEKLRAGPFSVANETQAQLLEKQISDLRSKNYYGETDYREAAKLKRILSGRDRFTVSDYDSDRAQQLIDKYSYLLNQGSPMPDFNNPGALPQMAEGGFLGVGGAKSAEQAARHLARIGFDNEEIAKRLIKDVPKDLFGEGVSEMDRQQLIKLRNYLDIMKQKRMPPSLLQRGLGALRSVGRGLMMNPFKVSPQGLAGAGLGAAGVALIDQFMDDDLSENEMEQLKLLIDEQLNKKEGEVEPTEEGGVKISEQSIEFRPASSLEMM